MMGHDMKAWKPAWIASLAALGSLATPFPTAAQQPLRLDTQTFVERVKTDLNGRQRRILASADRPASGDQLIVILRWRNESTMPLRAAAITRALPRGIELDAGDPAMQVSVDGGVRWGRLDQLWLPTPLGGTRRAVPGDITHVRWALPEAAAGQAGRLSYRATIR